MLIHRRRPNPPRITPMPQLRQPKTPYILKRKSPLQIPLMLLHPQIINTLRVEPQMHAHLHG